MPLAVEAADAQTTRALSALSMNHPGKPAILPDANLPPGTPAPARPGADRDNSRPMSLLPHQLELLSPARDADIGIEAINHGADAVYIGGPAFGARASAGNDIRALERLIRHAHRFGSRIFITLNTILRDDELDDARKMAWQVYEAGADALIIQDMGLLELDLPPIQLHASTQTDIRTPEKARFLQDAGLSQIVLARELDLQEIAAIRDALGAATDPARCAGPAPD